MRYSRPTVGINSLRSYIGDVQHLRPERRSDNLINIAGAAIGLHAARLPSPFVSAWARSIELSPSDLRSALFEDFRLIKHRCMRTTLHVLPIEIARIAHAATLNLRLAGPRRILSKLDNSEINKLFRRLTRKIEEGALSHREIISYLMRSEVLNRSGVEPKIVSRAILKCMWEEGRLCYVNKSSHWAQEDRYFDLMVRCYPAMMAPLSAEDATKELVKLYLAAYAPATVKDICWWSGLPKSNILKAIGDLGDRLIYVDLEGIPGDFMILAESFQRLELIKTSKWVSFLGHEDPLLKAYYESRSRYISVKHIGRLFNQIGEARSSILLDGVVIGLWVWSKKSLTVETEIFDPSSISPSESALIKEEGSKLEEFLRADYQASHGRFVG